MNQFNLISCGWTCYNGFFFTILDLELNKPNIDSSLIGIGFSKDYLQVSICYFNIMIYESKIKA